MKEHGSAQEALRVLPEVARAAGVRDYRPCSESAARAELKAGRLAGAQPVAYAGRHYPQPLMDINDPPPLMWALGKIETLGRPMVAMVGARNASSLGGRMARRLAAELSDAGYVVVSGLARGIDTMVHRGAMKRGTLAVMAGGVDVIYPAENAALAQDIPETGLRLSEQPMGLQPQARHFPRRNRIIAGLCRGVIVVEAAARSGSLITARCALDYGREVLAVPGHPFDARATGCNFLIRDGATLVRAVDDVIELLGPATPPPGAPGRRDAPRARCESARSAPARDRPGAPDGAGDTTASTSADASANAAATAADVTTHSANANTATTAGATTASAATHSAATRNATHTATPHAATAQAASAAPRTMTGARDRPPLRRIGALHDAILDRLSPSPVSEDQLIRDLSLPPEKVTPALLSLELDGKVARLPGGLLSRAGPG